MKICLVAPGFLPIPPVGWGLIENIIWDYKCLLEKLGWEVIIVNEKDKLKCLSLINECKADVCHCHFDQFIDILLRCNAKVKIISTHYGLIRKCLLHKEGHLEKLLLTNVFPQFKNDGVYVFALDDYIKKFLIDNFKLDNEKVKVIPNGAREDLIQFIDRPWNPQSICIGKIDRRKRQYLIKDMDVVFAGGLGDDSIEDTNPRLLGEWNRDQIYNHLTNNANSILLSYSEASPLVTVESLMAGLGLVISEASTANLDLSKPFITVIPELHITDEVYLKNAIEKNKEISLSMRKEIREYAIENFSLYKLVDKYSNIVSSLL